MAVERQHRPKWAEEFLRRMSEPVAPDVLARRQRAMDWIRAHPIDIGPDRVDDYIRAVRDRAAR